MFETAQHPVDCEAICASSWTFITLFAALVAIPTPIWAIMVIGSGWWYVWQRTPAWSWRTAWLVLAAAGAGLQVLFMLSAFRACRYAADCSALHRGDERPLELIAAFALASAVMMAVLILTTWQSRRGRSRLLLWLARPNR